MESEWRLRLEKAVENSGLSYREIGRRAGLGPNYVTELFNYKKEPGISKVERICNAIGVSFVYIVTGLDISGTDEKFIRMAAALPESQKARLFDLLQVLKDPQE